VSVRWQSVLIFCSDVFSVRMLCNMKASILGKSATFIHMFSSQKSNLLKNEIGFI